MSLLAKIQTSLQLQEPLPKPLPQAPPAPDTIIDIDQRDAFIAACMAVRSDPVKQCAVWLHMSGQGMNRATLNAAVKIICKGTDADLERRFGVAGLETVELRTASEWAEGSLFKSKNPTE